MMPAFEETVLMRVRGAEVVFVNRTYLSSFHTQTFTHYLYGQLIVGDGKSSSIK
jgi:hypothetical protein